MVREIVKAADELALADAVAQVRNRLPYAIARTGDIRVERVGFDKSGSGSAGVTDAADLFFQQTIMAQHVEHSFIRVTYAKTAGGFSAAKLSADGDFTFALGLVRQQSGRHGTGVNENERGIEQPGNCCHL